MKITVKENLESRSIVLQHNILTEATSLMMGREGALETEKLLYLMLATIDNVAEEDIIKMCNEDKRPLMEIVEEEIEPEFFNMIDKSENFRRLWENLKRILLDRCEQVWKEQNSFMGVIEGIVDALATISDEGKQEVLKATGKIAEQAFEKRTQEMKAEVTEVNDKLSALVNQYVKKTENMEETKNDAE